MFTVPGLGTVWLVPEHCHAAHHAAHSCSTSDWCQSVWPSMDSVAAIVLDTASGTAAGDHVIHITSDAERCVCRSVHAGHAGKALVAGISSSLTLCIHPGAQGDAESHGFPQLGRLSGIEPTHAQARQSTEACFEAHRQSAIIAPCLQPAT